MGDLAVHSIDTSEARRTFLKFLLRDVEALDNMLANDMFEREPIRIGAEQELCLVDEDFTPSILGPEVLQRSDDPHLTSEIARFNLELNLDPFELKGACFSKTEEHLLQLLERTRKTAAAEHTRILLAGILPTINWDHLQNKYMTPEDRYRILSEIMLSQRGREFEVHIQGVDELMGSLDSVLFEGCNTSFQMHLQIDPADFVDKYNWAQQLAGPVLAACANSPILLGRQLWMETRIALFRQSLDTRTSHNYLRDKQARVYFGNKWLEKSVSQLFKDHIARFPMLVTRDVEEDALAALAAGRVPVLRALRVHNGTVYNWNRPCYGRSSSKPHLRIENRYVPAGPTPVDEIANFAFWVGLMKGMPESYDKFYEKTPFDFAKDNFYRAARTGLHTVMNWMGHKLTARELILETLLPIADKGLQSVKVKDEDRKRYLSVIEARIRHGQTGACWQVDNFRSLKESFGTNLAQRELTRAMYELQQSNTPVYKWPTLANEHLFAISEPEDTLGQIMKTDLVTINEDEPVSLVDAIMQWHKIRHLPVEDAQGDLVGMITIKDLHRSNGQQVCFESTPVGNVMTKALITVSEGTTIKEGVLLMQKHRIGSLLVVRKDKLVGMITDTDIKELGMR